MADRQQVQSSAGSLPSCVSKVAGLGPPGEVPLHRCCMTSVSLFCSSSSWFLVLCKLTDLASEFQSAGNELLGGTVPKSSALLGPWQELLHRSRFKRAWPSSPPQRPQVLRIHVCFSYMTPNPS